MSELDYRFSGKAVEALNSILGALGGQTIIPGTPTTDENVIKALNQIETAIRANNLANTMGDLASEFGLLNTGVGSIGNANTLLGVLEGIRQKIGSGGGGINFLGEYYAYYEEQSATSVPMNKNTTTEVPVVANELLAKCTNKYDTMGDFLKHSVIELFVGGGSSSAGMKISHVITHIKWAGHYALRYNGFIPLAGKSTLPSSILIDTGTISASLAFNSQVQRNTSSIIGEATCSRVIVGMDIFEIV